MKKTICKQSIAVVFSTLVLLLGMSGGPVMAQDNPNTLSHDIAEKVMTFATVNPYTEAPGSLSITFRGQFHGDKVPEAASLEVSRVKGEQSGTFAFVPDDSSQPTINGRFRFRFSGQPQPHLNTIHLAFRMFGRAADGSVVGFLQNQEVTMTEDSVEIAFKSLERIE